MTAREEVKEQWGTDTQYMRNLLSLYIEANYDYRNRFNTPDDQREYREYVKRVWTDSQNGVDLRRLRLFVISEFVWLTIAETSITRYGTAQRAIVQHFKESGVDVEALNSLFIADFIEYMTQE